MWRKIAVIVLFSLWFAAIQASLAEARSRRSSSRSDYGYGYVNPNAHSVRPYTDRNGSLHSGHMQTNPNGTDKDNAGTQGNTNPWTGQSGTRRSRSPW